jgi:hypothetical protein
MKRGRKPAPRLRAIPPEVAELVRGKLNEDYLGFVAGTNTEDPKAYVARDAAARAVLDHLAVLGELDGEAADAPEASNDDLLLCARAGMASEDGT